MLACFFSRVAPPLLFTLLSTKILDVPQSVVERRYVYEAMARSRRAATIFPSDPANTHNHPRSHYRASVYFYNKLGLQMSNLRYQQTTICGSRG